MSELVTFGEAMLRLSPPHFMRLEQTASLEVQVGGAEMNVAVACARLGMKTSYVTRLPVNPLGRMAANKVREQGVDVSQIVWSREDRLGIYFVEFGAAPRASNVVYDRSGSAISRIQSGEVPWDSLFEDTRFFHISGITPALSASAASVSEEAMRIAKMKGVLVSCDLNYRAKLWTEEQAKQCMTRLMQYTDVLVTTEEDTERVFKITGTNYEEVAKRLVDQFGFKVVLITLRDTPSVWLNRWTAIAYAQGEVYHTQTYEVEIVDRVGTGDCCTAGFLYAFSRFKGDVQKGIDYGVALSALKHSVPGDLSWISLEEVESRLKGGGLRVTR